MTANEIRGMARPTDSFAEAMLQEIAAQLAELNEALKNFKFPTSIMTYHDGDPR